MTVSYDRRPTRRIMVGDVPVGGGAPITVQSMTITKTADHEATLAQLDELAAAGADVAELTRVGEALAAVEAELAAAGAEIVCLAGFMRLFTPWFIERWRDRLLNIHPSLLPAFPGAHAVEDALAYGCKVTGVTVHFVVEEVDAGPIVAQHAVGIEADDTVESLHARLKAVEHRLLPECVGLFCADRLHVSGRHVRISP